MLAITPYIASAHVQHTSGRHYEPCTMIGVDATTDPV